MKEKGKGKRFMLERKTLTCLSSRFVPDLQLVVLGIKGVLTNILSFVTWMSLWASNHIHTKNPIPEGSLIKHIMLTNKATMSQLNHPNRSSSNPILSYGLEVM